MLIPLLHRVIVTPSSVSETDELIRRAKAAGLEVQLDKREEAAVQRGTVIAVGDTAFVDYKATVIPKVGEEVYYAKYAGTTVTDTDGVKYLELNDEDILAIIKE